MAPLRRILLVSLFPGLLAGSLAVVLIGGLQTGCQPPRQSDAVRLAVTPREENALIADATVELAQAAPVYLEYGNAEVGWLRLPTTEPASIHKLSLLRLRPKTSYDVRAFALDQAGCAAEAGTASFETDRLPPEFTRFRIESKGRPSSPLTLMDIRISQGDLTWLVATDSDGQIVWYYPIPPEILREAGNRRVYGLLQRKNGNLLYLASRWGLEEITPDGQIVRRIRAESADIHHDLTELPDGQILFIGAEERVVDARAIGGPPDLHMLGGTLHLLDLEAGVHERVWGVFDALDPTEQPPNLEAYQATDPPYGEFIDWNHMNSVAVGARGNLIISLRHLDQILSLAPDLKTVEWRLGGLGSSFAFPDPSDRFYGQHAVTETPEGHILLFDNGNFRPEGEYSRALELELDFASMTARKVWEYRHSPDLLSDRLGSVASVPNGNRLVSFGFRADERDPAAPIALFEARPDGTPAWTYWIGSRGGRTVRYRAYPITSLLGEQAVEPTPISGQSR